MQFDAIVLAGGESSMALKEMSPKNNEALIDIGHHPMIVYIYQALIHSDSVRNIVICGPVEAISGLLEKKDNLYIVEAGDDTTASLSNGLEKLEQIGATEKILVLPSDIPFITTEAIDDFISRCKDVNADFHYPLIRKELIEEKYPGMQRTYIKTKEGVFTGGNLLLINKKVIKPALGKAREIIARRKNPVAIIRLFGFWILIKYLLSQMTIDYAEKVFLNVMGIIGKAVFPPYAEIGVDVDKPSDLEFAKKYLSHIRFNGNA